MDELRTWNEVAARLGRNPRGWQRALANHLKMDTSYLNRKLKTERRLTVDEARSIEAFIAGGTTTDPDATIAASGRKVPVYGYAAMGDQVEEEDAGDVVAMGTGDVLDYMVLPAGLDPVGECYVLMPVGESMEPRIFAGEPLLVLKGRPPSRNGDALIEFANGNGVVKTYEGRRNGRVYARQYNPVRTRDYDATKVVGIHRVIKL